MGKTAFTGPIVGNVDTLGGAGEGFPIELVAKAQNVTYFNDFLTNVEDFSTNGWTTSTVTAGTVSHPTGYESGMIRLDCPGPNQGPIVQFDGGAGAGVAKFAHTPAARVSGTSIASQAMFIARCRIRDVLATGTVMGLCEDHGTSGVIATPTGGTTSDNHIAFVTTSSGVLTLSAAGTADTNAVTHTGPTVADNDWFEIALRVEGDTRYAGWVRVVGQNSQWVKVGEGVMSTAWDGQMLPTFACVGGGTGDDLDVDYVGMSVKRDLTV